MTTITNMIGHRVTDTRTLRPACLTGPMRWKAGRLYAQARMVDTDRLRWIRTDTMTVHWGERTRLRADRAESRRRATEAS